MIEAILKNEDGKVFPESPHLSYSRIHRYLHCPEQYRLYYQENLRPLVPSASLVFGKVMHQALAQFFRTASESVSFFLEAWNEAKDMDLKYAYRESWEKLQERGKALLDRFLTEEVHRIGKVHASEKAFQLSVTSLHLPLVGVIDLVAEVDGKRTVVDFKTSTSSYEDHEVALSDQLTAYQLAEPESEQSALCVFVKVKEPRIEWLLSGRTGDQLLEFLLKAEYVANEITSGHFYKRPGKWCAQCDYLPVCLRDERRVRQSLIQVS